MKRLYIETYGCQMNVADSEVVASVMKMAGYEVCDNEADADAVFLNTCSVRENAENRIYHRLEQLHAEQKKGRKLILGVLGCMAERVRDDLVSNHFANLVCGPDAYLDLPNLIAQCETGHNAVNINLSQTETYREVTPQRLGANRVSGFVSIMRGCNNFCHYCIVPYTRGRERSRDVESILREVRDLHEKGFKEVTLLGQNVNSYGLLPNGKRPDDGISFAQLLTKVARAVPDMRVRFTTSNPEDMSDDILYAIAAEPNLCNHIHFPAQSGSDNTLRLMNLPASVQKRVVAGQISAGHARALLGLPSDAAMEKLAQRIVDEGLSVRSVEEIVSMQTADQPKKPKANKHNPWAGSPIQLNLEKRFDTKVSIKGSEQHGRIEIVFSSPEEMDRIIALLDPQ